MGDMDDVFDRAREARTKLQEEYDARNRLILDSLADIKGTCENATHKNIESLKAFSDEFDEALAKNKRAYKSKLKADYTTNNRRGNAIATTFVRLDEAIREEHDACIAQAASETGPILEKLEEHRQSLAATQQEREEQFKEYKTTLQTRFAKLRENLKEEAVARQANCAKQRGEVVARLAVLDEQQCRQDAHVRERLVDLRAQLEDEKVDTATSNQMVTAEMTDFIAMFEKSIAGSLAKQEATKKYLMTLKTAMQMET